MARTADEQCFSGGHAQSVSWGRCRVCGFVIAECGDEQILEFLGDMVAIEFPAQSEVFEPEYEDVQTVMGVQKFSELKSWLRRVLRDLGWKMGHVFLG
jgi:hypothetical protein